MSSNAGGLIRWPVYVLMPLGFAFLFVQGISELIKRFAFLRGLIEDPTIKKIEKTESVIQDTMLLTKRKNSKHAKSNIEEKENNINIQTTIPSD